jgi:hypothetical protein
VGGSGVLRTPVAPARRVTRDADGGGRTPRLRRVTDDMVEVRWRFRRRTVRIAGVVAGVVVLLVAWWAVAARGTVETGSSSWAGGHGDECAFPDDDVWAVYAADEQIVAVQTVRNPSPWPVEVVSSRPEAFRFGEVLDEHTTYPYPGGGAPPAGETSDRVVVPAGEEVMMWVVDPFPEDGSMLDGMEGIDDRTGLDGVDVQVWSLGLPHDERIEFRGFLWQSELTTDSPTFQRQLTEMCLDDA